MSSYFYYFFLWSHPTYLVNYVSKPKENRRTVSVLRSSGELLTRKDTPEDLAWRTESRGSVVSDSSVGWVGRPWWFVAFPCTSMPPRKEAWGWFSSFQIWEVTLPSNNGDALFQPLRHSGCRCLNPSSNICGLGFCSFFFYLYCFAFYWFRQSKLESCRKYITHCDCTVIKTFEERWQKELWDTHGCTWWFYCVRWHSELLIPDSFLSENSILVNDLKGRLHDT